ncbi:uncharacterized protein LOC143200004 [Rhynchophorus ferrugineus]|uniref:uncharacterized protein LOC143200004 n=1 Tax=Rhynchophorus ferrugineus TaxID=354439 RepID=UPI003FCC6851
MYQCLCTSKMKLIVFLAFASLARGIPHYPLWAGLGSTYNSDVILPRISSKHLFPLIFTQKAPVAEGSARDIVWTLGAKRNTGIEDAVRDLEREQSFAVDTNNFKTADALGVVKQELREKQENLDFGKVKRVEQLKDTLEAAIEAQLISNDVDRLVGHFSKTADQDNEVFEARIKKLVDKCTIVDIETELIKQQKIIHQLAEQEHFLEQQKQQLESQKAIVVKTSNIVPVEKLTLAEEKIKEEQRCLVSEKYARFLVVKILRVKLLQEEDKLMGDSFLKNVREDAAEERREVGLNVFPGMGKYFYGYPKMCPNGFGFC